MEVDLEEFRQSIIDSYISYTNVMRNFDTSWCDDGIRRAKEAKTMEELQKFDETIERAWDQID